jgi:hypothetical protein
VTRDRLVRALTDARVVWALVGVFVVRMLVISLTASRHADGHALLDAGRLLLRDPGHLYAVTAASLAATGMVPVHGLVGPPGGALLGALFAWLPQPADIVAWTVGDALALAAAVALLQRRIAPSGAPRALVWLVAAYFPPTFAELDTAQLGGWILLLGVASALLAGSRVAASGALAGAAAAIKLYPASIVLGVRLRRWPRWVLAAAASGAAVTLVAALRLGVDGSRDYVSAVLLPALRAPNPDCASVSVANLWARIVGGQSYSVIGPDGGLIALHAPFAIPALATALTLLTDAAVITAVVLAVRRSGHAPLYSTALALSLGGLLPGELNPYQLLPLLPVLLVVIVRCAGLRRWRPLTVLVVALLALAPQPCYTLVPNLWTVAALTIVGVCCSQARAFRDSAGAA